MRDTVGRQFDFPLLAVLLVSMTSAPPCVGAQESLKSFRAATDRIAARFHVRIAVDPEIVPAVAVALPDEIPDIDSALSGIAGRLKGVEWRRVYLPVGRLVRDDKLCAAVRALDGLHVQGLAIHDSRSNTAAVIDSSPQDPDSKPVYVLYSAALPADGQTLAERFAGMQQMQADLMMRLNPDEMQNPMEEWMRMFQGADKSVIEKAMTPMLEAGMKLWDSVLPERRKEMMAHTMQVMETYRHGGEASKSRANRAAPRDYLPELKEIVKAIADRARVTAMVDPEILVPAKPKAPDSGLALDSALDSLIAQVGLTAWRRIYLPDSKTELTPRSLGVLARTIDHLAYCDMRVENPRTKAFISLAHMPANPEQIQAAMGGTPPIHLLYASTALDSSSKGRYADLLTQQLSLLMRMGPDELAQVMQQGIQIYQNMDSGDPSKAMGLPALAGMMGVWFPREAKERRAAPP